MVNKKLNVGAKQKGFALVTTLIISSVVLVLVGSLFYKFSVNGKDLAQDTQRKQAVAVSQEATASLMKYVAGKNDPTGKDQAARIALAKGGASSFLVGDTTTSLPGAKFIASNSDGVATKAGYARFQSANGKGEFEVKSVDLGSGGATAGYNSMEADIISYVPSKKAATATNELKVKFNRTFPPVSVDGVIASPAVTSPETCTTSSTKATKASAKKTTAKASKVSSKATKSARKVTAIAYSQPGSGKTDAQKATKNAKATKAKAKYHAKADKSAKAAKASATASTFATTCTACASNVTTVTTTKATKSSAKATAKAYSKAGSGKTDAQKASKNAKASKAKSTYTSAVSSASTCLGLPPVTTISGFGTSVQSVITVPSSALAG